MEKLITALPVHEDYAPEDFLLPLPRQCPVCSVAYSESPIEAYYIKTSDYLSHKMIIIYSMYFCPHCERFFSICYRVNTAASYGSYYEGYISQIYPEPSHTSAFSDKIKQLSPKFVEIYQQSEKAENANLTEICGIGYRKSLEFLVKDYAIFFNPDKTEKICEQQLSPCIDAFIENKRIKTLAKASAWIGNDETHYVRKHENYNLEHLKAFIYSIVSYVDSELSFLEAEKLLSNPKK